MVNRVCLDCPNIGPWKRGRCRDCERKRDKQRGTKTERGYGADFNRERRRYQANMDAGRTYYCTRTDCKQPSKPINPKHWDLGHNDADRSIIDGPQHPECNRATSTHRINMQ